MNGAIIFAFHGTDVEHVNKIGANNEIRLYLKLSLFSDTYISDAAKESYGNMVIDLAEKGFNVIADSNPSVMNYIASRYGCVAAVYPAVDIKDLWVKRMESKAATLDKKDRLEMECHIVRDNASYANDIESIDSVCTFLRIPAYIIDESNIDTYDVNSIIDNIIHVAKSLFIPNDAPVITDVSDFREQKYMSMIDKVIGDLNHMKMLPGSENLSFTDIIRVYLTNHIRDFDVQSMWNLSSCINSFLGMLAKEVGEIAPAIVDNAEYLNSALSGNMYSGNNWILDETRKNIQIGHAQNILTLAKSLSKNNI